MIETQNLKTTKFLVIVLTLALLVLSVSAPARAATAAAVNVSVEGKALAMPVPPVIVDGRTLVGVRAVGEAVGGTVGWDPAKQQVTITRRSDVIVLTLGNRTAVVNGSSITMDVPAQLVDSRTMVPLRFIAEALGGSVEWDPNTRTANILRKPTAITGMQLVRDAGKTQVVLTLSEPLESVKPTAGETSLTLDLYPAVVRTDQTGLLVFDGLLKAVGLQADGRTVHLNTQLWNPPFYSYTLSPDGLKLTLEFEYTVTGLQYQLDGRIPVVNLAATGKLNYTTSTLSGPDRLVIDLAGGHLSPGLPAADGGQPLVTKVRAAMFNPDTARVVLDMARMHPYDVVNTELGLQVRFVPQIQSAKVEKLQGRSRITFATSLPVDARVSAPEGQKKIVIEVPQGRSALKDSLIQVADGTIDSITVAPGATRESTVITVNLPYYLAHTVVSSGADSTIAVDLVTSPVYGKRIWIDAGHGGNDPGTIGTTYKTRETDVNLAVALSLQNRLAAAGATVLMTRTGPDAIDFKDRPKVVNSQKPPVDIFVSIHHNSFGSNNTTVRGIETYYWTTNAKSKALAEKVHAGIVRSLGFPDRRVRSDSFWVIKETLAPSILVELGYLSNPAEEKAISEPGIAVKTYPDKASKGIADGILDYFWLGLK